MKVCTVCKEWKSLEDFHRNTSRPDGRQTICKKCAAAKRKQWGRDNPGRRGQHHRKQKYGLSHEEYLAMRKAQGEKCSMCPTPLGDTRTTVVDHNHETGKVRGVLCHRCNIFLGYIEKEPQLYGWAQAYLQSSLAQ